MNINFSEEFLSLSSTLDIKINLRKYVMERIMFQSGGKLSYTLLPPNSYKNFSYMVAAPKQHIKFEQVE